MKFNQPYQALLLSAIVAVSAASGSSTIAPPIYEACTAYPTLREETILRIYDALVQRCKELPESPQIIEVAQNKDVYEFSIQIPSSTSAELELKMKEIISEWQETQTKLLIDEYMDSYLRQLKVRITEAEDAIKNEKSLPRRRLLEQLIQRISKDMIYNSSNQVACWTISLKRI